MHRKGKGDATGRNVRAFICDDLQKWSSLVGIDIECSTQETLDFVILKNQPEVNDAV